MPPKRIQQLQLEVPNLHRVDSFQFGDEPGHASFSIATKESDGTTSQLKISQRGDKHGFTLADFALGPELGRGEGGGVRYAVHGPTNHPFALKEISIQAQSTRHQLAKELQMHKDCGQMPYIVQLYDVFYEEGRVYLVLELMDWGSLEMLLRKQAAMDPPQRMDEGVLSVVLRHVLSAMAFLHDEHHVIHRDLKPGNVVLDCRGGVKLSDFGVSRVLDNEAKGMSWVGTASYMSPERLQGCEYSHKADIWSIGVIALECALGRHPYTPPGGGELAFFELMQVVVVDPAPIPTDAGLSPLFVEFCKCCLDKVDVKRASARELLRHPFLVHHSERGGGDVVGWLQHFSKPSVYSEMGEGVQLPDLPNVTEPYPTGMDES